MIVDNPIRMTRRAFLGLPEYSTTLPTGTTPGKRWRAFMGGSGLWYQGRYGKPYPDGHKYFGNVPIFWRRIIVQGQEPQWPRGVHVAPKRRPLPRELPL